MTSKMKKILKFIVIGIVFLVIVLGVVLKFKGESLLAAAAETAGTKALNVAVDIDGLNIQPFTGAGSVTGVTIENPAGFNNPYLMKMKSGDVKVNLKTVLDDTIVIDKILLDDLHITFEQKGFTSNIKEITDNLKKKTEEKAPDKEEDKPGKKGKKVVVSDLQILNAKLSIKLLPVPGKADTVTVPLPAIKMKDVGKGEKMNFEDVVELIFVKISEAIAKAGSSVIPKDLLGPLNNSLKGAVDAIGGVGDEFFKKGSGIFESGANAGKDLGEGAKRTGEAITEGASKTLEGIGSVFGGKKEDKDKEE